MYPTKLLNNPKIDIEGVPHQIITAEDTLGADYRRWPMVLRLLAENVARRADPAEKAQMLTALRGWIKEHSSEAEIHYSPGRLLMHDTTSTPALVDMAAMRDAIAEMGVDPEVLSPKLPVEVSVDHSLAVEAYATPDAAFLNIQLEIRRNRERYRFLKWASAAMDNIHINPPGTGIMHTINLEQLATVVTTETREGQAWVVPDMMLGTDSHTPMINGLGVLGWGVGGLEAETVMFGMPTTLKIPEVVGVRLVGQLRAGVLATDLALVITQELRRMGVTGEFVEFFGPGVSGLTVGDRSVIANMAPEYGATTGFFPVDEAAIDYLAMTGRSLAQQNLVREYCQTAGYWFEPETTPEYSRVLSIDLATLTPGAAGPRRPQDRLPLAEIPAALRAQGGASRRPVDLPEFPVALASITSCTNTSDPRLIITAGLLARRAREFGLTPAPWVKTSLAPGSPAAVSYLARAGLDEDLSAVGFDIVGFGCATCIGNSGPLPALIEEARLAEVARPVAMLSGNRNFPGRVHPDLEFGFLMSPPLVIAYALAGDASVNLDQDPVGISPEGREIHLADLWPSTEEIDRVMAVAIDPADFRRDFLASSQNQLWDQIDAPSGPLFPWDPESTILRPPPFAAAGGASLLGRIEAHPLLVLGDDITTDHISPASAIPRGSFVADFLVERGEDPEDLNVFASRRGNWEVMARGAYYAKSVRNELAPDAGTAMTTHGPSGEVMRIWDAAQRYLAAEQSVIVIAGERYGMGSSRDWAAKVQQLLGVRAVLAASFERIHRSNLIGMGILPLVVPDEFRDRLHAIGADAVVSINADPASLVPRGLVGVVVREAGGTWSFEAQAGIETGMDVELLRTGGVIPKILSKVLS
ncbi:aconitate hydratase AcnA [Corynebacterium sp. A21]|uniref:aconitate hydratase AcnA n=1 Tax=Corynebacterium sp. A21 TaxID=3457318 RepID=UPI003FD11714